VGEKKTLKSWGKGACANKEENEGGEKSTEMQKAVFLKAGGSVLKEVLGKRKEDSAEEKSSSVALSSGGETK